LTIQTSGQPCEPAGEYVVYDGERAGDAGKTGLLEIDDGVAVGLGNADRHKATARGLVRIHFLSQPWASALPPSESIATWTQQVARRLTSEHDVHVWGHRYRHEPAFVRDQGVSYRFVVGNGDYRLGQLAGASVRFRPLRKPLFSSFLYHPGYHLAIARGLRRERAEVVHIHNFTQMLPLARRACPSALVVLHMHCEWLNQLDPEMLRGRLRHADLIVGCSEYITNQAREAFPKWRERFHTVYNGADLAGFDVPRGPSEGPTRVAFVGRISPEKGFHVLLDAFSRAAVTRPDLELVVVGREGIPPREMLLDLDRNDRVQKLNPLWHEGYLNECRQRIPPALASRVRFSGWLSHEELATELAAVAAVVVPSIWEEPFPMPVIEAQAAGVPVIASRVGGIPEAVEDGVTGLLVPPDDADALACALARVADDRAESARIGAALRTRRGLLGWDVITERVREVYSETLARHRASHTQSAPSSASA
jgi:glycosyltransferase involved in cell wall biosynthesis